MMRPAPLSPCVFERGPRLLPAFSLVELLVVIGILALLAAVLLPVFFTARAKAHTTQCAANLRQIGVALQSYVSDYDGTYPPSSQDLYINGEGQNLDALSWSDLLAAYTRGHLPVCPDRLVPSTWEPKYVDKPGICGYAYNLNLAGATTPVPNQRIELGTPENAVKTPVLTVAVFDSRIDFPGINAPDTNEEGEKVAVENAKSGATRHQNGANYLFADGHVKWFVPSGLRIGEKSDGVHPGFGL